MQWLQIISDLLFFAAYVGNTNAFPEPLSAAEERDCIRRMQAGDEAARDELIEHNLRLVAYIARKYVRAGRDSDDVVSIGIIGLIKAVSTYDPGKGGALSSYASRCVENEILMSLRAEKKLVGEVSLNEPIGTDSDGNDVSLSDILGTDADTVVDEVQSRMDAERVNRAMKQALSARERTVVNLRFGIGGRYRMTQREIANLLGISRSYISRIEKKALQKLTAALKDAAR